LPPPETMSERASPNADLPMRRFALADLVVDVGQAAVQRDGRAVPLPGLSFDLLVELARAAPDLLTHDELMERVWRGVVVSPETVAQRVKLLRDALGDDAREPRYVAGVRGRGYRLIPPVVPLPAAAPAPAIVEAAAVATPPLPHESIADEAATTAVPAATTAGTTATAVPTPAATPDESPAAAPPPGAVATVGKRDVPPAPPSGAPSSTRAAAYGLAAVAIVALALLAWHASRRDAAPAAPHAPTAPAGEAAVTVAGAPARTVAVLPFQNLSADPANAYIGLGVAETVLNRLAATEALFVVARSSSFAFENRNVDAREIGRQLGATYLVQGGVQRDGPRLRITAQVVDAATGRQIRGLSFDRTLADLFALQDEIATQVASALDVTLAQSNAPARNLDAHLEYLRGLAALGRWRVAETIEAAKHFREAQRLDPGYAAAYVGEAKALLRERRLLNEPIDSARESMRALVEKALKLDPNLGAAYVARAMLAADDASAIADLRKAVALSPSDAEGWFELAQQLGRQTGAAEEAAALFERAIALDPLQPRYRYVRALTEWTRGGDVDRYERGLLDVLKVDPNYVQALVRLAQLKAFMRGSRAAAIPLAERAIALDPRAPVPRMMAMDLYFSVGDVGAALDVARGTSIEPAAAFSAALARGDVPTVRRLAVQAADSGRADERAWQNVSITSLYIYTIALRDEAIASRTLDGGIRRIERTACTPPAPDGGCGNIAGSMAIAELEAAAERRAAATVHAQRAIRFIEETPGAPGAIVQIAKARMSLVLGKRAAALDAIDAASLDDRAIAWWVVLKHDDAFASLRDDPRFRGALERATKSAAAERSALEALRADGKVPYRPAHAPK
jgi:TolB-like protein/DNA-binding winged helix-turn-helix (wHTH) protein